jgi:hypothetical protein
MIAIGCGVITIIYSELSTHNILLIMYCVLYSLTIYSKLNKMENLVTFKTAQLAKSKGFNEPCKFYLMDSLMNYPNRILDSVIKILILLKVRL